MLRGGIFIFKSHEKEYNEAISLPFIFISRRRDSQNYVLLKKTSIIIKLSRSLWVKNGKDNFQADNELLN